MDTTKDDIFTVSEANRLIKNVIDVNLPPLWIEGEIANYVHHSSGHLYFSLKDENSTIRCAFFRNYNLSLTFRPKNGDKIIALGKIDVYEKTGTYQLLVRQMLPAGIGELQLKFLALKKKLEAEGLFSQIHKKELPRYPEKIGVITSATGAAFQDIKNVISRRYPHRLYLYPATVQGEAVIPELIDGIQYFNNYFPVDLIIIGRGGGSQEDLFCFNDEKLARAIFASDIPVISAVGHEIDFTIADFVADVRAPTPSAAAELAVPNKTDLLDKLKGIHNQLVSRAERYLYNNRTIINDCEKTLFHWHPRTVLFKYQQRLDEATSSFNERLRDIKDVKQTVGNISAKLQYTVEIAASGLVHKDRIMLESRAARLTGTVDKGITEIKNRINNYSEQLISLSPQKAMKRGYTIIRQEKKIISSATQLKYKESIELLLQDGKCNCTIDNIELNPNSDEPEPNICPQMPTNSSTNKNK